MLPWIHRTGAGLAANGDKATLVQGIVRDVVFPDVAPNLLRTPVGERVEFNQLVRRGGEGGINFNNGYFSSRRRALIAPLSGDPCVERFERSAQRLDLADSTTFLVAITVKREQTLFPDKIFHRRGLRKENLDRNSVMFANFVEELIGLRVQPACIKGENPELTTCLRGQIDKDYILGAAEADGD